MVRRGVVTWHTHSRHAQSRGDCKRERRSQKSQGTNVDSLPGARCCAPQTRCARTSSCHSRGSAPARRALRARILRRARCAARLAAVRAAACARHGREWGGAYTHQHVPSRKHTHAAWPSLALSSPTDEPCCRHSRLTAHVPAQTAHLRRRGPQSSAGCLPPRWSTAAGAHPDAAGV